MKGSVIRAGGLGDSSSSLTRLSWARLAYNATVSRGANGGTAYTHGNRYYTTAPHLCTGAEFYWSTAEVSTTIKVCLWDLNGNLCASGTVTTAVSGLQSVAWTTPIRIASLTRFTLSLHDMAGGSGVQINYQTNTLSPLGPLGTANPQSMGVDVVCEATQWYTTGDAYPVSGGVANAYICPVAPILEIDGAAMGAYTGALGDPYPLAFDGDSITEGYGTASPTAYCFGALVPFVMRRQNTGVPGNRCDQMTAAWAAGIGATCQSQSVPPILTILIGFNNLLQSDPGGINYQPSTGTNAAATFAQIQTYVAQARASGVKKILGLTMFQVAVSTTYYTAYIVAQISALNALLRSSGLFDAIVDLEAISTTITRQSDGLHPDVTGHVTIANALAPVLLSMVP